MIFKLYDFNLEINKSEFKNLCGVLSDFHKQCFEKFWTLEDFAQLVVLSTTAVGAIFNDEIDDESIMGFIVVQLIGQEAEILTLGVLPDFRNQGVASQMLDLMETYIKNQGGKSIYLEVSKENVPAQKLYASYLYKCINVRHNYYADLKNGKFHDAIILKKEI